MVLLHLSHMLSEDLFSFNTSHDTYRGLKLINLFFNWTMTCQTQVSSITLTVLAFHLGWQLRWCARWLAGTVKWNKASIDVVSSSAMTGHIPILVLYMLAHCHTVTALQGTHCYIISNTCAFSAETSQKRLLWKRPLCHWTLECRWRKEENAKCLSSDLKLSAIFLPHLYVRFILTLLYVHRGTIVQFAVSELIWSLSSINTYLLINLLRDSTFPHLMPSPCNRAMLVSLTTSQQWI